MRPRRPSRSRFLAASAALIAAVGLTVGVALPAAATPVPVQTYVALGDSYAAGQATDCTHTASSYPRRLDALPAVKLVRDVACAHATSDDVLTKQIGALGPGVTLVTVTVGANDLDVAGLEQTCTLFPDSCLDAITAREALLPTLGGNLTRTFAAIAAKAPRATIVVTGYPALFDSAAVVPAEVALNGADAALNATISGAVSTIALAGGHIRYVDVQFPGHTVDSATPWFFTDPTDPNVFHPTPDGDAAFAAAIAATL